MTNCDDEITTAILVTDITDHFQTILINKAKKVNAEKHLNNKNGFVYKRKYTDDNVPYFKRKLSQMNWDDTLHGLDADCDFNKLIDQFNEIYDQCIPLRKCKANRRKVPQSPWIATGMLKGIQSKNKLNKEICRIQMKIELLN